MTVPARARRLTHALLLQAAASTWAGGVLAAQETAAAAASVAEGTDYAVYDPSGATTSFTAILDAAREAEVLLVGEEHDDMPGHAFEASLLEAVFEGAAGSGAGPPRPVVLSLEMFERDVQYVLDEYLADLISEEHFLRSSRPWDDYDERYRPLVEAAKRRGAPVVAANAPRRYVNRVTRDGPESLAGLSDLARSFLPPLPFPGPSDAYRAEWDALMASAMVADGSDVASGAPADTEDGHVVPDPGADAPSGADGPEPRTGAPAGGDGPGSAADTTAAPDHSPGTGAIHAQALWDASMGHAIADALVRHLGSLVVHFAGSFHVARGTGIPERIEDYRPGTRVVTVVITKAEDVRAWTVEEHGGLADFVVLTRKPPDPHGGRP